MDKTKKRQLSLVEQVRLMRGSPGMNLHLRVTVVCEHEWGPRQKRMGCACNDAYERTLRSADLVEKISPAQWRQFLRMARRSFEKKGWRIGDGKRTKTKCYLCAAGRKVASGRA